MNHDEIIRFARSALEPLGTPEVRAYRCGAFLRDRLHLPCVLLVSADAHTDLALRRFDETRRKKVEYRTVVQSFVTERSAVATWDIQRLERSPYAIPLKRLVEIKGETIMGWTQFTATMRDGRTFTFGTTYETYFFEMPEGYVADDIVKITPAPPLSSRSKDAIRERPHFTCCVEGL